MVTKKVRKGVSQRCIDLFCGAGGLSLGLDAAGWKTEVAIDYDASACKTFQANFPTVKVLNEDIRKIDWTQYRGKISLVAGGPPCQPFSVAGDQLASQDTRDMLPEFVRAVREIRPAAFLMENVAGLASRRHQKYLENNLASLRKEGFNVSYAVLNAADYGVPQERLRVIVLGLRDGQPRFPTPTHGRPTLRPHVSAQWALQDAPKDIPNRAIVTYAKNPVLRRSPFAGMLVNGGGRPINLAEPSQTIPASAGGNRTHIIDRSGVLLDYHEHLLSGGRPRCGIVKGVRRLTVRESARLQTFPDKFKFMGQRSAQYRHVGNAVPPLLAKAVAKEIVAQL
jgi:DNA (cytosine-5)-methyltransferase 1